jgi:hypothetical protein
LFSSFDEDTLFKAFYAFAGEEEATELKPSNDEYRVSLKNFMRFRLKLDSQ